MWLGSNRSRSVSVGDEFLKVQDNLGEQCGDDARGQAKAAGEHLGQQTAQMRESQGAIDTPRRIWGDEVLRGQIDRQRIEAVSYTHLDVYKRQEGDSGTSQDIV